MADLRRSLFLSILPIAAFLASTVHAQTTTNAEPAQARIIVKWKANEARTRVQALSSTRSELRRHSGLVFNARRNLGDRTDVVELEQPLQRDAFRQALATLRAQPDVEYAVPDQRRHIAVLPNDTFITATSGHSGQWYLLNTEVASINAYAAWDLSKGGNSGTGVIVAVVDTGVRFDHPDLAGKLLPGYDFVDCDQSSCSGAGTHTYLTANDGNAWDADASDPGDWISSADQQNTLFADCAVANSSWHGTRVAGIIGATTDNSLGVAGTGWNARVLPVRALGKCGGYDSDIIAGIKWAAGLAVSGVPPNPHPAKVINLSLGSPGDCQNDLDETGAHVPNLYQAYRDTIAALTIAGVTVVASAGNDSAMIDAPANCSGVIAVTGVRNTGTKVGFSSLGPQATIAAPAGNCGNASGACLYTLDSTTNLGATTPGVNDYTDQYDANLGTSFSAPIVSGTIALMLGVNNALTPAEIISTLRATATPFPATATNTCQVPTSTTSVAVNESECNCTTSTCGAGLVNAYEAVLAVSNASSSSSSSSVSSASSSVSSASSSAASAGATAGAANDSGGGGGGATSLMLLLPLAVLMLLNRRPTQSHA